MARGTVSWLSKKQALVALSTSEVALSTEVLIPDLKVTLQQPTLLIEGNQGAIAIAKNPVAHA